jgi:hypothetical protein
VNSQSIAFHRHCVLATVKASQFSARYKVVRAAAIAKALGIGRASVYRVLEASRAISKFESYAVIPGRGL